MVGTGERKTIGFPLEKCTFLGIEEGLLEGLGTHNIDFPKEKEGFWGVPDRGGWMVDTGERKLFVFLWKNVHFWKQMKVCWRAWERKILIFPKENEGFLGGPDRGGWMVGTGERKTIGFPFGKMYIFANRGRFVGGPGNAKY